MDHNGEELIKPDPSAAEAPALGDIGPKEPGAEGEADHPTLSAQAEPLSAETSAAGISTESKAEEQQAPALPYPVVGGGASGSGPQELSALLENLDANTGAAFVMLTPLAPDQTSFLASILERYKNLPVSPVENGQQPAPNHIYVLQRVALPQLTVDGKDRLIAQLGQDLNSTQFHLQSLVEERDARNRELVSLNEDIQSANQELQSTNEELERTRQELQSANEELQTVNEELQQRNNVLAKTGNDLTNLINSVNIPLLMLTSDLHIRQFTPPMQKLLSVRPTDIGRSITEIRLQLSISDVEPILLDVLETLGTREMEVQDRDGRWHLLRVRPYRTSENKIEGLVVVLLDIDQLRRSHQSLVDARDFASSVVESAPAAIVVLNEDFTIRAENTAFRQLTQMDSKVLEGRSLPDLFLNRWGADQIRGRLQELLDASASSTIEFEYESIKGSKTSLLVKGRALTTEGKRILLLFVEDITQRKQAELLITKQKQVLVSEMEVAARKLDRTQEELRGLTAHLFTVQEDERQRVARGWWKRRSV